MKLLTIEILALFILFGCVKADIEEPTPKPQGQTRSLLANAALSSDYYCFEDQKIPLYPSDKSYKLFKAPNGKSPKLNGRTLALHPYSAEMDSLEVVYEAVIDNNASKSLLNTGLQEIYSMPCYKNSKGEDVAISNMFYVFLKNSSDEAYLRELAESNGVLFTGEDPFVPLFYTLVCDSSTRGNSVEMANLFHETGVFAAVAPDFMGRKVASPDPLYPTQWNLKNDGQIIPSIFDELYTGTKGIDIGYESLKPFLPNASDVIVAVIDTGVESNHPDLQVYDSWDAVDGKSPCKIYSNHGTECAGLISALPENGIGLTGIAPDVKVMALSIPIGIENKSAIDQSIIRAFDYAVDNGADIISNSWGGGGYSETVKRKMKKALFNGRKGKGCVVVFSSGNSGEGGVTSPGDFYSENLCVGAINPNGERVVEHSNGRFRWGSNYGYRLDVVAPGTAVPTTTLHGKYNTSYTGTSAACPQVAAIAALVLSVDPELTRQQVTDIIEMTATKVGPYEYIEKPTRNNGLWNNDVGYGMANAYKAVIAASPHFEFTNKTFDNDNDYFCQNFTLNNVVVSGYKIGLSATTGNIDVHNLSVNEDGSLVAKSKKSSTYEVVRLTGSSSIDSSSERSAEWENVHIAGSSRINSVSKLITTLNNMELSGRGKLTASAAGIRVNGPFRVEKGAELRLQAGK